MVSKNNISLLLSIVLGFGILGFILADLHYMFGNYDTPFIVAFGLYVLVVFFRHASSKVSFICASILVLCMGILYGVYGPIRITERTGEWFYLFFLMGIIQYAKETWFAKNGGVSD